MKYQTSAEIRKMFLDFFKEKNHMIEPGAPLIPNNDPSLLWINSGVSALKKYFDGSVTLEVPRIANSQRSLRTNDIENVGLTARHHTMFEMLGNFSIGDYFKKEAIAFAWEFLTSENWINFDIDKLYVTIYTDDDEAYKIWHEEIGLDDSRIFRLEGNFWEIGAGPSGPNSEIFYDRGIEYDPENIGIELLAKDMDNDRYIEIWNIVFSQYNAVEGVDRKDYKQLPQKNIDTGMGLERLTSIVQHAETNFETDLFMPIIKEIEIMSNQSYTGAHKRAFKVIADHIRALTFALADGAMFSNEGRGYVLKRLLRRASRFGLELGIKDPFLYKLVDVVTTTMEDYYPYLNDKKDLVKKVIKLDEERFQKTLSSGLKLYEEVKQNSSDTKIINGEDAFKLYDTYGFPIELVLELSEESSYEVDIEGFKKHMLNQQEMARASFKDSSNMSSQSADLLDFKKQSDFIGYCANKVQSKIIGLFQDGVSVQELKGSGEIIFDKTVFYAESGGQISDKGTITVDNKVLQVIKVRKAPNGQHLHLVEKADLSINQECLLQLDIEFRKLVQRNHTATHLLHQALKDVVGKHANQAGSYVTEEYLRFDFSHYEKINKEQLTEIENIVNEAIFSGSNVSIESMNIQDAKDKGAMALFSDKYDDEVRVVEVAGISIELCGGTHVSSTSEIGLFKIEKEESVGSGIRRIIAKTSKAAYQLLKDEEDILNNITHKLGENDSFKALKKLDNLLQEQKHNKQEITMLKEQLLNGNMNNDSLIEKNINGINYIINNLATEDVKDLKAYVDKIKNEKENTISVIYSDLGKKPYVVGVTNDLVLKGKKAKDIAQIINQEFNGKGGGKPDMAQGGVSESINCEKIIVLFEQI
ncbi:alanine--tRNA ligase [Mycoplasma sp. P36-A1]|uniref:alanine--tRNA ligase n=1 Tax=Mycoplasma sp. P36-A1 TaxID=3252900 RepID=UPI003C2B6AEC